MSTRIDPIAGGVYRISTFVPEGPPGGITFNQFLIEANEPMLIHTGPTRLFRPVRQAVATVLDPARLRWISSTHASRSDEYGALADWMRIAPDAEVVHGWLGCFLCLDDVAPRPPRPLADGETLDLVGARVRWLDTPHVPGPWEAGVLFEETTRLLFCGDLFSRTGPTEVTTGTDVVEGAIEHEQLMHGYAVTPETGASLRRLAQLSPRGLALMHGPTFLGDAGDQLERLADYFDTLFMTGVERIKQWRGVDVRLDQSDNGAIVATAFGSVRQTSDTSTYTSIALPSGSVK